MPGGMSGLQILTPTSAAVYDRPRESMLIGNSGRRILHLYVAILDRATELGSRMVAPRSFSVPARKIGQTKSRPVLNRLIKTLVRR